MSEPTNQNVTAQTGGEIPPMSDDEVIAFTRQVRVKIVTAISSKKPEELENSDKNLLTNMLNGLDSQALGNKRVAAEQKSADNAAVIVAELLRSVGQNAPLPTPREGEVIDVTTRVVPPTIADVPALPGEMDVAPPQLDYASFVRSQGRDADQLGKDVSHPEANSEDGGTP